MMIDIETALGNFIISRKGKCINLRQFCKFLSIIEVIDVCTIYRKEAINTSFEEFGDNFNYLVKTNKNVMFPINMKLLERSFRIGLPKDIVRLFDEVTQKIQDTEEDYIEYHEAYIDYLKEFNKLEKEKDIVTNSLQNVFILEENNKKKPSEKFIELVMNGKFKIPEFIKLQQLNNRTNTEYKDNYKHFINSSAWDIVNKVKVKKYNGDNID